MVLEASTELRTEYYRMVPNVGHLVEVVTILMIRVHRVTLSFKITKENDEIRIIVGISFKICSNTFDTHMTRESYRNKDVLVAYLHSGAQKRHSEIKRTSLLS